MVKHVGSLFDSAIDSFTLEQKLEQLRVRRSDLVANLRPDLVALFCKQLDLPSCQDIEAVALMLKEDIAILHNGSLSNICFCFPSSWIPARQAGKTLAQIHEPVADGKLLQQYSARIADTMAVQGPFRRWVWTISTTGSLSNHPDIKKPSVTELTDVDDLWFRTERQTTFPLGDGASSGFLVLVETRPLREIWQLEDQKKLLLQSLNSMSDSVLEYKKLTQIKNLLNNQ
jgi:hypothetical protein